MSRVLSARDSRVGWFARASTGTRPSARVGSVRIGSSTASRTWPKDLLSSGCLRSSPGVQLHFRHYLPLAALLLPLQLHAQSHGDSGSAADPALVVQRVLLEPRDIFDPHERSWLARMANRLHFQTRPWVVRRELLFEPGEPYDSALVAESERNL